MDPVIHMEEAIERGNIRQLKECLRKESVTELAVELAANKLAEKPESTECKEVVDLLLTSGWNVNKPLGGIMPTLLGLLIKDSELVEWLLEKGANPSTVSPQSGDTPLSLAIMQSSPQIINLLIDWNKRYHQHLDKGELVYCAVRRYATTPNLEILHMLISSGAPVDEYLWDRPPAYATKAHFLRGTPLHEACKRRYTEVVNMLIAHGADPYKRQVRFRDDTGKTPYEIASRNGDSVILEMIKRHQPEYSAE